MLHWYAGWPSNQCVALYLNSMACFVFHEVFCFQTITQFKYWTIFYPDTKNVSVLMPRQLNKQTQQQRRSKIKISCKPFNAVDIMFWLGNHRINGWSSDDVVCLCVCELLSWILVNAYFILYHVFKCMHMYNGFSCVFMALNELYSPANKIDIFTNIWKWEKQRNSAFMAK